MPLRVFGGSLPVTGDLQAVAACWAQRERFVVLDAVADDGERLAALRHCWLDDPRRCRELVYIALAPHGWNPARWAGSDGRGFAQVLAAALPPTVAGMHRLSFDGGRLQLLLCIQPADAWPRRLVARVDLLRLPWSALGSTTTERRQRLGGYARLAAARARLEIEGVPPGAAGAADAAGALAGTGFEPAGRTEASRPLLARYEPRFVPPAPPGRCFGASGSAERHAIVIGAGLAGCAAAWALAERGWRTTLIDRHRAPAAEASGNPGGVFHGVFHPGDGLHARFNRAAALEVARAVRIATEQHGVAGAVGGLLRLETRLDLATMRRQLASSGFPESYLQALGADEASARCGMRLAHPCWLYAAGGWVDPRGLARSYLARAADAVHFIGGVEVADLVERTDGPDGAEWTAFDRHGAPLATAPAVVLANAGDALRLACWPWAGVEGSACEAVRGQLSTLPARLGIPLSRLPITGAGYLLPAHGGRVVFGATSQAGDRDLAMRQADHAVNLQQLGRLAATPVDALQDDCDGRAGLRWAAADRLPLIGAVPAAKATAVDPVRRRLDQPRWVPRRPGMVLFTALGSRGIGWSALGGQIVASWISGSPAPVEADLLDAVDPARLVARTARRGVA